MLTALALGSASVYADCKSSCDPVCKGGTHTSKSHFHAIDPYASGHYLRHALSCNGDMEKREDGFGGAFNVTVFGGKTTCSGKKELGRYFGINHKNSLVVAGPDSADFATADIDARHLNIEVGTADNNNDFKSTITLSPEQIQYGAGLSYKQILKRNEDDSARFWFEVAAPFVHVENKMNFEETIADGINDLRDETGLDDVKRVANAKAAFQQSNWKYGRIHMGSDTGDCKNDNRARRFGNIEFKLGYNSVVGDCANIGSYLGLVTTAFNKSHREKSAQYMFAPRIGQDHWGIAYGTELGFKLREWDNSALYTKMNIDGRYLFNSKEYRMFDLVGKQWSRYMEMYENKAALEAAGNVETGTSGINLMTRKVDVTPGFQMNLNSALVYQGCRFMVEVGHTLSVRQAEEISPDWVEGPVLKHEDGNAGGATRLRTVALEGGDAAVTYANAKIKECDVDWDSAAHPAVVAHSLYGAVAYQWNDICYPTALSVGGAYDYSRGNAAADRWTLFGQLNVSF